MINHPKTPRPADPAASNTHIHISKNIPPEYYFSPEELQLLSDPSNPRGIDWKERPRSD